MRQNQGSISQIVLLLLVLLCNINSVVTEENKCTLKIVRDDQQSKYNGVQIQLYTAAYSSSVDNLKYKSFDIFRAEPVTGCYLIDLPELTENTKQFLVTVNGNEGSCGFKRRTEIVKQAGAKGIIIVSKNLSEVSDPYIDYTDQTFFVFFTNDSLATDALLSHQKVITGTVTSSNKDYQSKKKAEIWISSLNQQSYELLEIFSQAMINIPQIQKAITWKPRHALWGCSSGSLHLKTCIDNPQYVNTCACAGQFCSPEQHSSSADTIVKEDIRQKIIFDDYNKYYFNYTLMFKSKCFTQFKRDNYIEDCATMVMNSVGLNSGVIGSKVDNFISTCQGKLFEEFLLDRNRYDQLGYYPAFMIERQPIQFKSLRDFQVNVCRQLQLTKSERCAKITRSNTVIFVSIHIILYAIIIAGILAIVIFLVRKYRKSLSKSMHKEIKMTVEASVANYFALSESK